MLRIRRREAQRLPGVIDGVPPLAVPDLTDLTLDELLVG